MVIYKYKKRLKDKRGLLLLELIVSIGIFIVAITIGMSAILSMFAATKKSQSLKDVMANIDFSLDSMSREIVMSQPIDSNLYGSSLRCSNEEPSGDLNPPLDCLEGGTYITFCSSNDERIAYRLNGETLERLINSEGTCPITLGSATWQRITSPEIRINNMKFYVSGTLDSAKQPKVIISIQGDAGSLDATKSSFEIQTTLSQRVPDLTILLDN